MLDQAFEALKTYDWGVDYQALAPIDEAVVATQNDHDAREELESRLASVLKTDVSRDAIDFVCRKLMAIGTAASVPALAELLPIEEHSHMARYALERIPAPEAAQALRDALPKLDGEMKLGVIGSLGSRGDATSVPALAELLDDQDAAVARSAALALGAIRDPGAIKTLRDASPQGAEAQLATVDACLACAEGLLASGKKLEAHAVYKSLAGDDQQPKQVRLAATRGMLACAGKKD